MWSGPRNLSTAMLYAFGNRADCAAWDEPFYGAYLALTGIDHPLRDATLQAWENDPARVAATIGGPVPDGREHWYQKHMTHHMVDGIPLDWVAGVTNVFLIRHPARVIASYIAKRENPDDRDIGFADQGRLFDAVTRIAGNPPMVVDSADIRRAPRETLAALCDAIGLPFDPAMLSWPKGPKPFDGPWAPHWYNAVHASTGFGADEGPLPDTPDVLRPLLDRAMPVYERLHALRIG